MTTTTTDSQVAEWLRVIGEDEFREQVAADCRSQADAEVSEALRHPAVCRRWHDALKLLLVDINAQFAQRNDDRTPEGKAWRVKALRWQESLIRRRDEAKRRCTETSHLDPDTQAASKRDKQRRGAAGELAVERLIERHREEFDSLLVEEFEAAGLEPPHGVKARRRMSATEAMAALRDAGVPHR